jgi:hypothetical protein
MERKQWKFSIGYLAIALIAMFAISVLALWASGRDGVVTETPKGATDAARIVNS